MYTYIKRYDAPSVVPLAEELGIIIGDQGRIRGIKFYSILKEFWPSRVQAFGFWYYTPDEPRSDSPELVVDADDVEDISLIVGSFIN